MSYTAPGYVPVTQRIIEEAEADARAHYGVPDDYEGSAMQWLQARTRRTLDRLEALFMQAQMEDDGHDVSYGLGCNCERCRTRRKHEAVYDG